MIGLPGISNQQAFVQAHLVLLRIGNNRHPALGPNRGSWQHYRATMIRNEDERLIASSS